MSRSRLCRSFQTAPAAVPRADTAKYLRSALTAEGFEVADWLVPDLEDGTAPEMKDDGLENACALVPDHEFAGELWPRIQWSHDDAELREAGREQVDALVRELGDELDGVVVPKVGRLADVERAATVVGEAERTYGYADGSIGLSVIVETARARSDLRRIAAFGNDSRLTALVFGPVDYAADVGARAVGGHRPRWDGLLETLSNEASAAGVFAIGGPFDDLFAERAGVTYYDAPGYAAQIEREARVGLDGSWSLYPKQTIQANHVHVPSAAELDRDVSRIERFETAKSSGTGAVTIDGQMVDEATLQTFHNTVETVRTLHERRPEQARSIYDDDLLDRALALG